MENLLYNCLLLLNRDGSYYKPLIPRATSSRDNLLPYPVRILRISLLLFVFLAGPGTSWSQPGLDSLNDLVKAEKNDSMRFLLLLDLSKQAEFSDFGKSRDYANQSSDLADRLGNWAKGKLYLRLAYLQTMEGDYAEALQYDMQCTKLYAQDKDSTNLARAYIDVGADYRDLGDYDEAYFYFMQSLWISKNFHDVLNSNDSLNMSIALHNMGTVFRELGQFDLAYQHLIASQKISNEIADADGSAYSHDELGELFRKKGDYADAEKNLLMAAALARGLKIRILVPTVQLHLANLYLDKGDYPRSQIYFDSVRNEEANISNPFFLAECDLGTGQVMTKLGKYPEALQRYQKTLNTARELNARNLALTTYSALASLYEITKDYKKSLEFHQQHNALRDSIFSKSTMEKLLKDQIRFQTMNKDLEIEALSQLQQQQTSEIKRQELVQNVLVIIAVLSIILLYTVYRSSQRRKRINMLLLNHQEEIKRRSIELEQLNQVKDKFFSIISHDLRSPINALAGTLDLLSKQKITSEEFSSLTEALRTQFNHTRTLISNLLDWTLMQMDKLKIQQEKINLFNTTEESFETLRNLYPKDIHCENRIDPGLTGFGDPNIVSLVLRNLILNAIKFTEPGGRVWVEAREKDTELVIAVSDSGTGIKSEIQDALFKKSSSYTSRGTANEKGTGLGLILCKEFIEKNGGEIWLESKVGEGSTFYFTLPKYKKPVQSTSYEDVVAY